MDDLTFGCSLVACNTIIIALILYTSFQKFLREREVQQWRGGRIMSFRRKN